MSAAPRPISASFATAFRGKPNSVVEIGEVRTLFRMPDLFSLALGGGSIVSPNPLAVGPHSVGYRLTEAALVFGGRTITAVEVEDMPLAYLPGNALRVRVRVAGEMVGGE